MFYKTIVITEEYIALKKKKKFKWIIYKKDILECEYHVHNVLGVILPKLGGDVFFVKKTDKGYFMRGKFLFLVNAVEISPKHIKHFIDAGYNMTFKD